ncbi:MAG: shikimate kinase, partial [Thermoanaerobaculia bacterium]|nr:shikimate kinase [Thermoanaerobaculia bacterium]
MRLVFLHGPPACGKLTVARSLAGFTGLRLFHNHLTVNLATSLFPFGSEPFVRLREDVWLAAFREAAAAGQSLIFTFNPEATVRHSSPEATGATVEEHGGRVVFVELTCAEQEIERRLGDPSRRELEKLTSVADFRRLLAEGAFAYPPLPEPLLRIDTTETPPATVARRIADA